MTSVMDEYLDSPIDNDDIFPCKGCGEILEEGKAFELAGNRWHLDCFRCNTCGTLLDSDANLLLLGDGSLICNNCTYSCSACGNKIEDLAILTGDQAFCATCFRCRNCKRKIENLRYARTSQGIFCMSCHESLMARRRKKSKAAAQAKAREKDTSPMITDKSLPALPPNAIPPGAFSEPPAESDTPTELSPRPRPAYNRNDSSSRSSSRPARSPERTADASGKDSLGLPQANYRNNRNSSIFMPSDATGGDAEAFFIPVALDPGPAPTPPRSTSDNDDGPKKDNKDYFSPTQASPESKLDSSAATTPHIAFQEKGRQSSSEDTKARPPVRGSSKSSQKEPSTATKTDEVLPPRTSSKAPPLAEDFKLQDAPRGKKLLTSRTSSQSSGQDVDRLQPDDKIGTPRSSLDSRKRSGEEVSDRSDSLNATPRHDYSSASKPITRKEVPQTTSRNVNGKQQSVDDTTKQTTGAYMQPRQAPVPPGQSSTPRGPNEKAASPKLRWSAGGEFSMDEDMARILGTDEDSSSILRRVSNVVRHGRTSDPDPFGTQSRMGHTRSASETTRTTASPRWPRTPVAENGQAHDISSPLGLASPSDDPAFLKRQLRNSEQRVAELERQFSSQKDLQNLNKKVMERRKTVLDLDTQTEIMIRQLEVLAGYVQRAKDTKTPIDPRDLEDSAIKDFVQKLDKVKQSMAASIEQLHQERDQLVDEKNQAMADRDRALLEFEQLSSKNAQLADMNNDLTHQIQERFKSQIGSDPKVANGLGIYPQRGSSVSALQSDGASINTATTLIPHEHDDSIVEAGPTVVTVRKGQVKKFNWKKGSKTIAQNVTKGVNRAVVAFQQERERNPHHGGLTGENIGLPYNMTVEQMQPSTSLTPNGQGQAGGQPTASTPRQTGERQGFGFFSKRTNTMPKGMPASMSGMSTPTIAEAPTTLFGSDLAERADYERRQIPSVVTRCIEEVELRGMDIEGIYRKTGGNSLVKIVQDGFEKSEDYDISDPSLDITAVTSVLKQYFRKLPVPLLTFDVYERVLESNAIANEQERCAHLSRTFASMPPQHRDCLEFVMFHLNRVAQREPENLMSPKNLAVVFAPTIMRDTSIEREMTDMHAKSIAVQFIIENTDSIFAE
ncbi:hypothetical protein jhhlp_003393 [Lomentospora prolificans]|uniref:Uncharacterized protein n=1 Tax=Lomentospora prolificans TaxID=41688 RepID=A0A2N3N8P7_9PEZI|nr:hypothetical protein jhhlp_003393 [Lomentospora prolificans]